MNAYADPPSNIPNLGCDAETHERAAAAWRYIAMTTHHSSWIAKAIGMPEKAVALLRDIRHGVMSHQRADLDALAGVPVGFRRPKAFTPRPARVSRSSSVPAR